MSNHKNGVKMTQHNVKISQSVENGDISGKMTLENGFGLSLNQILLYDLVRFVIHILN